jgi:hypothetical protein
MDFARGYTLQTLIREHYIE